MQDSHPPQENIEIFTMIYQIETALRELIIEVLGNIEGKKWYKKCLPGDILVKYSEGRKSEEKVPWTQSIHHNPIYYVDFPDLKKIIENNNNWKKAFERIFARKEIVTATLSEIEPIRNKIAHNRKATKKDVMIMQGAFVKLSTAIGSSYFAILVHRCTFASNIYEQLVKLQMEITNSWSLCHEYRPLEQLEIWASVSDEWWFDDSYLSEKIDKIEDFYHLMDEYSHLPRSRGTGHKIESWVKSSSIDTTYVVTLAQLNAILAKV